MTPLMKTIQSILCLAVATHCWAEDNSSSNPGFFTHENPGIQIAVSSEQDEVAQFVNLGLKECLYGNNAAAQVHFDEALRADEHCVLAHIGMLMVHPIRSEIYRHHLQKLSHNEHYTGYPCFQDHRLYRDILRKEYCHQLQDHMLQQLHQ